MFGLVKKMSAKIKLKKTSARKRDSEEGEGEAVVRRKAMKRSMKMTGKKDEKATTMKSWEIEEEGEEHKKPKEEEGETEEELDEAEELERVKRRRKDKGKQKLEQEGQEAKDKRRWGKPKAEEWDRDADEGRTRTRKRKARRHQNPFEVEKNKYNLQVFEAVEPFVEVTSIPVGEKWDLGADKVSDGRKIHPRIIQYAWEELFDSVWASRKSIQASTELGGRPIHAAYLATFKYFVRNRTRYPKIPAPTDFLTEEMAADTEYTEDTSRADEDEGGGEDDEERDEDEGGGEDDEESVEEEDEIEGIFVKTGGNVVTGIDMLATSDEGFIMSHEGDDKSTFQVKTNYDFKVKVSDKRLNGQLVTILLVECQWDPLDINKIFQAAGYATKDALNNIRAGRLKPIFLQTWGERCWRYGILVPHGIVTVRDNDIVNAHGLTKKQVQVLRKRLTRKCKLLSEKYGIENYPNREYVVAHLYVVHQKYSMPFVTCAASEDMAMFIEALLRILVGDRILAMSPEEFLAVINARKEERSQEKLTQGRYFANLANLANFDN